MIVLLVGDTLRQVVEPVLLASVVQRIVARLTPHRRTRRTITQLLYLARVTERTLAPASLHVALGIARKGKERLFTQHLYTTNNLKALRHGSHSFTCKYTMPAFPS